MDENTFVCSAPRCSARVTAVVRPPRLHPEHVALLLDPAKIKERVQHELDEAPERLKGYTVPEPVHVVHTLKRYIDDVQRGHEGKRVAAGNKPFLTTLGEPCRELLQYLGFRYEENVSKAFTLFVVCLTRAEAGERWLLVLAGCVRVDRGAKVSG